jgi:cell wall-associated NlpC family hydrolase
MSTIGWLLIFLAVYLFRAVMKGQAFDQEGNFTLPQNIEAEFTALVTGDTSKIAELDSTPPAGLNMITKTTGPDASTSTSGEDGAADPAAMLTASVSGSGGGSSALLTNMRKLGNGKPYVFGASGPGSYDCSGLVWAAMRKTYPDYKGGRFTTYTMTKGGNAKYFKKTSPHVGAIVLWESHVGVVSGDGVFYSARNPRSGIGESKIAGFMPREPAPTYWEYAG